MIKVKAGDVLLQSLTTNPFDTANYHEQDYEIIYVMNDPIYKTGKIMVALNEFGPEYFWERTRTINKILNNKQATILFHWEV